MFISGKRFINLFTSVRKQFTMPGVSSEDLKQLEDNLNIGGNLISHLKEEIKQLMSTAQKHKEYSKIKALQDENKALMKEINNVKTDLIKLQVANGVQQIPIPGDEEVVTSEHNLTQSGEASVKAFSSENALSSETTSNESKPAKAAKAKKPTGAPPSSEEPPIDVGRLDIRVGKVLHAQVHPDANQLYIEQIDVGEEISRTVVSGLVRYVPLSELDQRMVLVLCNLKPVKMRGIVSEAMVLCANAHETVELLTPPPDAKAGDIVTVPGYPRQPDLPFFNPKKKIFEKIAEDLIVNNDVKFMRHTEEYNKQFESNVKQEEEKSDRVNRVITDEIAHAKLIPVYNELGEVVEYKDPPDFGQLDIRVGLMHLLSRHPNPDKHVKYVETITIGGKEDDGTCDDRQVESAVPKLYCLEKLRIVKPIVICNPKPITSSRGFESTIVVLCARKGKKIELLSAPEDANTGDHVIAQGYNRIPEIPYVSDIFSNILKDDLRVNDKKQVEFKGVPLTVKDTEGYITTRTFKNCPVGLVFDYTGV